MSQRVLVLVADADLRRTLTDWLGDRPDVVVVADEPLPERFDCCLVDPAGLERHRETLAARREAAATLLPVVAVAEEDPASRTPALSSYTIVDEVLVPPLSKAALDERLDALLRARSLSTRIDEESLDYRGIVDGLPDGVVLLAGGRIVHANRAAAALLGHSPAGERLLDLVAPEDRDRVAPLVDGDGLPVEASVPATIEGPEGSTALEVAAADVVVDGEPWRQLILRDRFDDGDRHDRLRLYERAMDQTVQGITIADATLDDEPLVYANRSFSRITGYDVGEILGRNCRFLQGPGTDEAAVERIREAIDAGEPVVAELLNYRADGEPFWNRFELTPVHEGDDLTHFVGLQRDVSERKRRERELERYETMDSAAGDAIYTVDGEGVIRRCNPALARCAGYDHAELVGSPLSTLFDEAAVDRLAAAADAAASTDERASVEVELRTARGARRLCEVTVASLPEADATAAVHVLRDVTEERGREQRLAVFDRVLRHNLRNKLAIVLGEVELALDGDPDPAVAETLERIRRESTELLSLSQEARDHQDALRGDAGTVAPTDVPAAVRTAVDRARDRFPAARIDRTIETGEPAIAHDAIETVVEELITNAVRHSDRERPRVAVTVDRDGDRLRVRVADDGPGIPAEEIAVLREGRETQLSHVSGIGLWLVRWAVERAGGELRFEANEPRGSVVELRFRLPEA